MPLIFAPLCSDSLQASAATYVKEVLLAFTASKTICRGDLSGESWAGKKSTNETDINGVEEDSMDKLRLEAADKAEAISLRTKQGHVTCKS